jgi:hypothetical protein
MQKIRDLLDALYSPTSVTRGLYIAGEAGNSKSYEVEKYHNELKLDYVKVTSRVTSLALYFLLHKHNGRTIVFDDVAFDKAIAIDLIKSALNPEGLVSWHTSSSAFDEEVPPQFVFNGKIIVITNEGIKETRLFYPMLSRCYFLEQNLSLDEYKRIAELICKSRNVDFSVIGKYISLWLKHRDLRIINKATDFVLAGKESLVADLFEEDEELKKLDELSKMYSDKMTIRKLWCSSFDKSKRSFYRVFKSYKDLCQSAKENGCGIK